MRKSVFNAVTPPLPWGCEASGGSVLLVPVITGMALGVGRMKLRLVRVSYFTGGNDVAQMVLKEAEIMMVKIVRANRFKMHYDYGIKTCAAARSDQAWLALHSSKTTQSTSCIVRRTQQTMELTCRYGRRKLAELCTQELHRRSRRIMACSIHHRFTTLFYRLCTGLQQHWRAQSERSSAFYRRAPHQFWIELPTYLD